MFLSELCADNSFLVVSLSLITKNVSSDLNSKSRFLPEVEISQRVIKILILNFIFDDNATI